MKRISIFLFLIVLVSSLLPMGSMAIAATPTTFTGEELLGKPTNNSITINIVPDSTIEYYHEYGTSSGGYTAQTSYMTATGGEPHEVVISGLQANTRYYYRMLYHAPGDPMDDWVTRDEYTFHTQRAPGSTFTFTIIADSHAMYNTRYQQAIQNVSDDQPDFHFDLGDTFMTDNDGSQSQVNEAYLAQRDPLYIGGIGHSAPIFLASGNHENEEGWNLDDEPFSPALASIQARKLYYPTPISDGFYSGNDDILADIDAATYGDQFREDYYAWTWGDALFVVLDPYQYTMENPYGNSAGEGNVGENDPSTGDSWNWTLGEQQYNWFKGVLENSNAKYKFVFAHHVTGGMPSYLYVRGGAEAVPYYEWGGYNWSGTWQFDTKRPGWGDTPIHQLMVDNHVSAFFHGHDHQYAYEVRDGVVYQCLPKPGTGLDFNYYSESDPYTERVIDNSGHLRVEVTPEEATVEYVRSNITEVSHSYTIEPNSAPTTNNPPDQPVLVSPDDGGEDISTNPTLEVTVSDPDADALDVTFYGREASMGTGEDFTIIALPDTQYYSESYPDIFSDQTQWIVDNQDALNIVYVAHEGDIVQTASSTTQWDNADAAMSLLEDPVTTGLTDGIPYGVVPGNHDEPTTNYNNYFGIERFDGRGYYGGHYGSNNDSNYTLFSAAGMDFIVVNLEYQPGTDILNWADGLLETYSDRWAIVVSHYILNTDASWGQETIFTSLEDNPNLFLMLCGHMHDEAQRTETRDTGNPVHVLLADYQDYDNGGNGYLRILQFSPADDEISVETYSPWLDSYETDADSQFVLAYDMEDSEDFINLGTVSGVTSGGNAYITWPDLATDTAYEWYVEVSDDSQTTTGPTWSFTTGDSITNSPPTANAGDDQTVEDTGGDGSEDVMLDGTGSTDTDGTIISYVWSEGGSPIANDATPTVSFDIGTHTVTLEVTDDDGATDSDTVTVTVVPTEATGQFEFGVVTVSGDYATVNLDNTYVSPVVVCSVQYNNNTTPVVTRVSNVTSTSFDVRLQNPSGGAVAAENVNYLVVEEGAWTIDGVKIEAQKYLSTVTDENNRWVGESQSYQQSYTNPVVLGQVMSENDPDWSVFWCQGSSRTNPPSATALKTGKTVAEDTDTSRADETIGFIVFEAGHGMIDWIEFEAFVGIDSIRGVGNSPPYVYSFDTAFALVPQVVVTTMAGVDGYHGGWAYLHGPTPVTTTNLYLSIDEDQIGDIERNHTTEQVSYAVFSPTIINEAPVANNQSVTTPEDTAKPIFLTASDAEGDPLTYAIISSPSHGTLEGTAPDVTYTPDPNYNGPDSFTFKASDGMADSNIATVSITVTAVNDPPVAYDQAVSTDEDTPVAIILAASDVDEDGLSYTIVSPPSHGILEGTAPNLTYTFAGSDIGPDSFTFKASDGMADSNIATVSITVTAVNHPPAAYDQAVSTDEDTSVVITLGGSDDDGDTLTYEIVDDPSHGTLSGTAPDVTYDPDTNYFGSGNFTFRVWDGQVYSNEATVSITVNPDNDAPVADPQNVTTEEDTAIDITLTGTDPDGDELTYVVVDDPSHGTLSGSAPNITYTPETGYIGEDSFTFKVWDGTIDSVNAEVVITINPMSTPTIYVYIDDIFLVQLFGGWRTCAKVTLSVIDNTDSQVANATVTGRWEDATTDTESGTTDADGLITFTSDYLRYPSSGTEYRFEIDTVTKSGYDWDKDNSDLEGGVTVP